MTASASRAPSAPRRPFADRLLRGASLAVLSLFHLQLKVLAGLVRVAISTLRKAPGTGKARLGGGRRAR